MWLEKLLVKSAAGKCITSRTKGKMNFGWLKQILGFVVTAAELSKSQEVSRGLYINE